MSLSSSLIQFFICLLLPPCFFPSPFTRCNLSLLLFLLFSSFLIQSNCVPYSPRILVIIPYPVLLMPPPPLLCFSPYLTRCKPKLFTVLYLLFSSSLILSFILFPIRISLSSFLVLSFLMSLPFFSSRISLFYVIFVFPYLVFYFVLLFAPYPYHPPSSFLMSPCFSPLITRWNLCLVRALYPGAAAFCVDQADPEHLWQYSSSLAVNK